MINYPFNYALYEEDKQKNNNTIIKYIQHMYRSYTPKSQHRQDCTTYIQILNYIKTQCFRLIQIQDSHQSVLYVTVSKRFV